jgi:hypothetical protein
LKETVKGKVEETASEKKTRPGPPGPGVQEYSNSASPAPEQGGIRQAEEEYWQGPGDDESHSQVQIGVGVGVGTGVGDGGGGGEIKKASTRPSAAPRRESP